MARTVEHTPEPWRVGEMCGGCINVEFDGSPGHPRGMPASSRRRRS
jgi:hypothetical protein